MRSFERFDSLVAMFRARAAEKGEAPFLWAKRGGAWEPVSWREAERQMLALAGGLKRIGLQPGDRVLLVSENRPEWCIADLAIMAAGCVTVPAYTTNKERDHQHVLDDSGASAAIVSTAALAGPLLPAITRSTGCERLIAMEPLGLSQSSIALHDWSEMIGGAPIAAPAPLTRQDLACLIYTSGTGGAPRGVMLSHGAILHNVEAAAGIIAEDFGWDEEVFLSFLPLSHAYEHTGGQFLPIGLGGQIYYAESLEKLPANIQETRPTVMTVVPRLLEVIRQRIVTAVEKEGRVARYLMKRAVAIGPKRLAGRLPLWDRPIDLILERALRPKVRARFGGRMKALVSGGAPLNPEVGLFFDALGVTLLQGYGQTEAAPIISCNRPKAGLRMATVGPPVSNAQVMIGADGEIMAKGEMVMLGYWRNEALTRETVRDGWLMTGDIGHVDDGGRLVITDRKKDIIVLDKGDNVAPQRVEGLLTLQPEIAQAMVVGDRRPYLVGLVVPEADWSAQWAKAHGKDRDSLAGDPDYLKAISAALDRVNAQLSVIEKVRRFILADAPFTVENGQLTPSIKIRRHVLKEVYGERLDALYRK